MASKNGRVLEFCEVLEGQKLKEMGKFKELVEQGKESQAAQLLESIAGLQEVEESVCLPKNQRRDRK